MAFSQSHLCCSQGGMVQLSLNSFEFEQHFGWQLYETFVSSHGKIPHWCLVRSTHCWRQL